MIFGAASEAETIHRNSLAVLLRDFGDCVHLIWDNRNILGMMPMYVLLWDGDTASYEDYCPRNFDTPEKIIGAQLGTHAVPRLAGLLNQFLRLLAIGPRVQVYRCLLLLTVTFWEKGFGCLS